MKGITVEAEMKEIRGIQCIIRLKGVWTESKILEWEVHQCQTKRSVIPLCPEGAQLSLSDISRRVIYRPIFNHESKTKKEERTILYKNIQRTDGYYNRILRRKRVNRSEFDN